MVTRPGIFRSIHSTVSAARLLQQLRGALARPHDNVGAFLVPFIDVHRSGVLYVFALMTVYNNDHRKIACAQHTMPHRDRAGRLSHSSALVFVFFLPIWSTPVLSPLPPPL